MHSKNVLLNFENDVMKEELEHHKALLSESQQREDRAAEQLAEALSEVEHIHTSSAEAVAGAREGLQEAEASVNILRFCFKGSNSQTLT